jgi:orotate phosphoribosyltransferase
LEEESLAHFKDFLIEDGVLVPGHFVFASGRHSKWYVNKTAAFVLSHHAQAYARRIAEIIYFDVPEVEAVVGPELGAITFMADVRMALYELTGKPIAGVMATKVPGTKKFEIGRDQARFLKGKQSLVLEDVLTTGESALNTVEAISQIGGNSVAVGALWNRGGVTAANVGVPKLFALIDEQLEDFLEEDCPDCLALLPVHTHLGKGRMFLQTERARNLGLTAAN